MNIATKSWQMPRRSFLKGLGTLMALPALEAMLPGATMAAGAVSGSGAPKRLAFVYMPNGMIMEHWTPEVFGSKFALPHILEPLKDFQSDFQVMTGLAQTKARANGDGAGDHARANATFLTGCQARKTAADIKIGVSVDQIAAQQIGRATRLPSLELGCDRVRTSGACDSGYSCAYQFNLAWKTESTPMPPEVEPRAVFDRLFMNGTPGESKENRAKRDLYNKSILDFVLDDASRLKRNLGVADQRKLDEYMEAVRDIEVRIAQAEKFTVGIPEMSRSRSIPKDYNFEQHLRLMYDLLTLSFQTDTTRISTFLVSHDGSNRPYPFLEVPEGHHDLSHHQGNQEKIDKIRKINRFHMEQFAYFLNKLKSVKEGDGTLLDNSMIVLGSGIADANRHSHHNLPVLLAGKGGGTLTPGRHMKYPVETPLNNLYLSLLDRMGVKADHMGDSTGRLDDV